MSRGFSLGKPDFFECLFVALNDIPTRQLRRFRSEADTNRIFMSTRRAGNLMHRLWACFPRLVTRQPTIPRIAARLRQVWPKRTIPKTKSNRTFWDRHCAPRLAPRDR